METHVIFGAPGTGKTTRLMQIIEELLHTYDPSEIAFVSFTKTGVQQGIDRASKLFNIPKTHFPYFSTIHSMAFANSGMNVNDLIKKKQYKVFSEAMGMNFLGYYTEDLKNNDDRYLFFTSLYRNNKKFAMDFLRGMDINKAKYVSKNYRKFKKQCKLFDFTDMLERFVQKNVCLPVKIAIIDEAQDLTTLQWQAIWTAFRNVEKLYIAGDDDQAIYQWTGADVDYFLNVQGTPEVLPKSYRLPESILQLSKTITNKIEHRVTKDIESTGKQGNIEKIVKLEEVPLQKNETYMFLTRNNYFIPFFEEYLREKGLLYYLKGVASASLRDYNLVKLYLRKQEKNNLTEKEEYRLKEVTKKAVDFSKTWDEMFTWKPTKIEYFKRLMTNKNIDFDNINIKVSTIHTAKGDEADNVILLTNITKNVYQNLRNNASSEHRVFYVAVTRARKNLFLIRKTGKGAKYEYQI